MANVLVLGAGGWGLGLALAACRAGHTVTVWSCFEQEVAELTEERESVRLLPGVIIPEEITFTTDEAPARTADLIIVAVPSIYVRSTAARFAPFVNPSAVIADASKGIEEKTGLRLSQVIENEIPGHSVVALSGPTHAEEVGRGRPTSIVSACKDATAAKYVQDLLMQPSLRVYINPDIVGVELGGALKNIIALAAGICDGLNVGDNGKAAMMTRGLAEMARLGEKLGGSRETFFGLAGVGDLIVTCGSVYSRNHRAGVLIGKGLSPQQAVAQVGTVEGFFATRSAYELACRYGVEMPITQQCYEICYNGANPAKAVKLLMNRRKTWE